MEKQTTIGIVTARKCDLCDHNEIGITTDQGNFIPLKPGMVVNIIQSRTEPVTSDEALNLLKQHLFGKDVKIYGISESLPDNCAVCGLPENVSCWYILMLPDLHPTCLASSRMVCISKDTGEILYDGPAGDEG